MVAITTLLVVLLISLVVVRIAAVALTLTGLARSVAAFQARSAWTGTGFTTSESEALVGHPVRRQIITVLMMLRSVGLVTAASTLMLSFVSVEDRSEGFERLLVLVGGLLLIWLFARSSWLDKWMSRIIAAALKRYTSFDAHDYAGLLHLAGEYAIMEIKVGTTTGLAGRTIGELELAGRGIIALGVARPDGSYVGAPRPDTSVGPKDVLILYGRSPSLAEIGRPSAAAAAKAERELTEDAEAAAGPEPGAGPSP